MFFKINVQTLQTFMCFTAIESVGLIVLFTLDLQQLYAVMGKPLYVTIDKSYSLEIHLALNLCRIFESAEMAKVITQRGDK